MSNLSVSVVVIGSNEGERLSRCLESIFQLSPLPDEVIYVDSNSTDDSIERAKKFPVNVLKTVHAHPSPSIPRNAGWRAAKGAIVMFIDGDCMLDPGFLNQALPPFTEQAVAVVCGQTVELYPEANIYHRVFSLDWNPVTGIVDSCGGNALVRREVLELVDGFDEALLGGEEPDLCRRIRAHGDKILKLPIPMVVHDLNMSFFKQYWERAERTGYAYASVARKYWKSQDPLWKRESVHNFIKGGCLLLCPLWAFSTWFFDDLYWPFFLFLSGILILVAKTIYKVRLHEASWKTKIFYALHSHFQHIPMFFGQLAYYMRG